MGKKADFSPKEDRLGALLIGMEARNVAENPALEGGYYLGYRPKRRAHMTGRSRKTPLPNHKLNERGGKKMTGGTTILQAVWGDLQLGGRWEKELIFAAGPGGSK